MLCPGAHTLRTTIVVSGDLLSHSVEWVRLSFKIGHFKLYVLLGDGFNVGQPELELLKVPIFCIGVRIV